MKKVDVNIISTVRTEDGEEKTEFFTTADYVKNDSGYSFSYKESGDIGYESCSVSITASDGLVVIERTGPAAAVMNIEKGKKHHCIYGTPYGEFTMGINTFDIQNTLNDEGGRLYFKYGIDINSDYISENEMEITIN